MTATTWSIGSTFTAAEGGTPVPDANGCLWFIEHVKGWHGSPAPRTNVVDREQADGVFDGPTFQPGRVVSMDGWVEAPTQSLLMQAVDQLAALLVAGSRTDTLTAVEAHMSRQIAVRRDGETLIDPLNTTTATFSILLYAGDPVKYSVTLNHATTGLYSGAGIRAYPTAFPVAYGPLGSQGIASVYNAGNLDAYPVLTITNPTDPLVNPRVRRFGDTQIGLGLTIAPGDFLEIDMANQTVLLNGVASRYTSITPDSDFWSLPPGDSQILFTADSGLGAVLDVAWRDPYA
jgi:hypothetical protein